MRLLDLDMVDLRPPPGAPSIMTLWRERYCSTAEGEPELLEAAEERSMSIDV
jgi:hypothetical protein